MRQVAVVSGGSGGIGRAVSLRLCQDGYQVIALYHHNAAHARDLCKEAAARNGQVQILPCDVTSADSVKDTFDAIFHLYHHVNALVTCQGIASIRLLTDTDDELWNHLMSVNLSGTFRCIRAVLPSMISRRSGTIVTVSSMWGETGASCEVAYSATKAGIIGMTKALAKEVGPSGVRVNCVSPGVIATEMNRDLTAETMQNLRDETPLERIGMPEEVADAVAYLASSRASFITGQVLGVSGGFLI